jgi:hypothetical protein
MAAIDNTHHDMTSYIALETEKCAFCHSKSLSAGSATGLGQVGTFCAVVCHTTYAPASPGYIGTNYAKVDASVTGMATIAQSHGYTKATIATTEGGLDSEATVTGTSWPHTNGTTMQCTSCHSVHDGSNPPFLNAPLSSATANDNAASFCQKCHSGAAAIAGGTVAGRFQAISEFGAHPTEFALTGTLGNAGPAVATTGVKLGRSIVFKAPATIMNILTNGGAATIADFNALDDSGAGNYWQLGTHLMGTNGLPAASGATAKFGCYSCHMAHQAEQISGTSTDDLQQALIAAPYDNKTGDATDSTLCVACHGDTTDTPMGEHNPGSVTSYSHPANSESGTPYQHDHIDHAADADPNLPDTGFFPIDVTSILTQLSGIDTVDVGLGGEVLCVTCHDVHGGVKDMMAIRNVNGSVTNTTGVCNGCHGTRTAVAQTGSENWHHPTTGTGALTTQFDGAGAAFGATLTAAGAGTGSLSCDDCHVFNGTAHNW